MLTHQFDCTICLNVEKSHGSKISYLKTDWKIFTDSLYDLPPGLKLMECQGCGALGVKMLTGLTDVPSDLGFSS